MTYAESGESGNDSDVSEAKPPARQISGKGKNKVAELASKRRKTTSRKDDDDFEALEESDEDAQMAVVVDSESASEAESDTPDSPPPKKKKGPTKAKASPPSSSKPTAPRPMLASASSSSMTFLTGAERKAENAKEQKQSTEQPFDFLLDPRDKEGNRPGEPNYDPRTLKVPKSAWNSFTPFEKQFWEIKQNHYDTVLFFQKGKFYELYENDATLGANEFSLKLTDRVKMKMVRPLSPPSYRFPCVLFEGGEEDPRDTKRTVMRRLTNDCVRL